jgi:hypothetical protein
MKVIPETYLMKIIPETYLMKVIPETIGKSNYLKVLGSKKTKWHKQDF